MRYAVVDIETTGGSPQQSRITEIAIFLTDGVKVIDQFVSLINPEQPIPPFITRLTGITDEMVSSAPTFDQVAPKIALLTKDAVFVAHNVSFDYGMIRSEFSELGMEFQRQLLCTVKSSRKVFPGYASYSLGNICKDLEITLSHRHRAAGDAEATVELFHRIFSQLRGDLATLLEDGHPRMLGDPLADQMLSKVPESSGVYFLHDHRGEVIFISSGANMRKKVLHHFQKQRSRLGFQIRNSMADVSFEITGSLLVAHLMEIAEIKRLRPVFNRKPKKSQPLETRTVNSFGEIFYVIDKGPDRFSRSIIRINPDGVGWGFLSSEDSASTPEEMDLFIRYTALGKDYSSIVERYLSKNRVLKILPLKS